MLVRDEFPKKIVLLKPLPETEKYQFPKFVLLWSFKRPFRGAAMAPKSTNFKIRPFRDSIKNNFQWSEERMSSEVHIIIRGHGGVDREVIFPCVGVEFPVVGVMAEFDDDVDVTVWVVRDILPPPVDAGASPRRQVWFLLNSTTALSINKLTPCVPRFFYFRLCEN